MAKNDSNTPDDSTNELPQVGGDPNPNAGGSLAWLEEVKDDAAFNYLQREREAKAREEYEESKRQGKPNPNAGAA